MGHYVVRIKVNYYPPQNWISDAAHRVRRVRHEALLCSTNNDLKTELLV